MSEKEVKNFKSLVDALVVEMKTSQEQSKKGRKEEWEKLKQKGVALGALGPLDSVLFEGMMYVSESRTEDDITTLAIIARLAQFVEHLYSAFRSVGDELRNVKGVTEKLPALKQMAEKHDKTFNELQKIIDQRSLREQERSKTKPQYVA